MAFHDEPDVRTIIHNQLSVQLTQISAEQIASYINDHRVDIAPKASPNRKAIDHDTLKRFRTNPHNTHPAKVEIMYRYLVHTKKITDIDIKFTNGHAGNDQFFALVHKFFGVRERNDDLCKSIAGTYALYFRSEDHSDYIVRGAITFSFNKKTHAYEVIEHQEDKSARIVEDWEGYYIARRTKIIIIMHGKGQRLDNMPKFYILRTPYLDKDDLFTETTGRMLKLGTEGPIYDTEVLLRRDNGAMTTCDRLPEEEIKEINILRRI